MKKQILQLFAESMNEDAASINMDASPAEDYHMDSIAILDFIIRLEDEYGIDFEEFSELSNHMDTVNDMIDYMVHRIGGGGHE